MRVYSYADGKLLIAAMTFHEAVQAGAGYLGDSFDVTASLREVSVCDMTTITLPQAADDTDGFCTARVRSVRGDLPEVIGGTDFTG